MENSPPLSRPELPLVFASENYSPESLEYKAYRDPLTGLLNRHGLEDVYDHLQDSMAGMFSVVAVDLDNLTDTNNTYGHSEGDKLLINTSSVIKNTIRNSYEPTQESNREHELKIPDIVAFRIGGDEFAILLIGADTEEKARRGEERLIQQLDESGIKASSGNAVHAERQTMEEFINVADKKLYEEKEQKKQIKKLEEEEKKREEELEKEKNMPRRKKIAKRIGSLFIDYSEN